MAVTEEQIAQFIGQLRELQSLDFPFVARAIGLNWFTDLAPLKDTHPTFRSLMEEYLQEVKFSLLQRVHRVGREGKRPGGGDAEVSHINAIIKFIDSGAILGSSAKSGTKVFSPEEERAHLKRLGYSEEAIERILNANGD
jgi:hypothetical protein